MLKHRCISAALFALALAGCQGRGLQPQNTNAAMPQTNDTIPTTTSLPSTTEQSSTTVETTSTTAEITPETVPVTQPRATVPATTARTTAPVVVAQPEQASTGTTPPDYIKQCESGGNYGAVNPNGHYGAWQFSLSTWRSVGGTGNPADASPAEQDYRAAILWDGGRGASHWECA